MSQLGRVAEVCKFDFTFPVGEYVITLDVSMHDIVRVQVVQASQSLTHRPLQSILCVLFSTSHVLDNWSHCIVHKFNENPQNSTCRSLVIISIYDTQAEAVLATTHPHQCNLVIHQLFILRVARGAELKGELLLINFPLHFVNFGKAADTQLFLTVYIVEGRGISCLPYSISFDKICELSIAHHSLLLLKIQSGTSHDRLVTTRCFHSDGGMQGDCTLQHFFWVIPDVLLSELGDNSFQVSWQTLKSSRSIIFEHLNFVKLLRQLIVYQNNLVS